MCIILFLLTTIHAKYTSLFHKVVNNTPTCSETFGSSGKYSRNVCFSKISNSLAEMLKEQQYRAATFSRGIFALLHLSSGSPV
jgi:hypothetical protein